MYAHTYTHIHMYVYICVCVCIYVCARARVLCVCVYIYICVCASAHTVLHGLGYAVLNIGMNLNVRLVEALILGHGDTANIWTQI